MGRSANVAMVGFFTAITGVVSTESVIQVLPEMVPERFLDQNIEAFEKGYKYGLELLKQGKAAKSRTRVPKKEKAKA